MSCCISKAEHSVRYRVHVQGALADSIIIIIVTTHHHQITFITIINPTGNILDFK